MMVETDLQTMYCVCGKTGLSRTGKRKVVEGESNAHASLILSDLGHKLESIASLTKKLPSFIIVVICRQCFQPVERTGKLENELRSTKKKIADMVNEHVKRYSKPSTCAAKHFMSPSIRGIGVFPVNKKSTPVSEPGTHVHACSRTLFPTQEHKNTRTYER